MRFPGLFPRLPGAFETMFHVKSTTSSFPSAIIAVLDIFPRFLPGKIVQKIFVTFDHL